MNVLVLGGTRYFGVHMVNALLAKGHVVTIATRGIYKDSFGDRVTRKIVERTDTQSLAELFKSGGYDVICDNISYCSNDVKALLSVAKCNRYVMTSSMSVYANLKMNTTESGYNPLEHKLIWCDRADFTYDEIKRQAECALFTEYSNQNAVAVRFPYVIGEDDYTNRLYFYVEHIVKQTPMYVDNMDVQMSFVSSNDAGEFLAWLAESDYSGVINGSNTGTISLHEIAEYAYEKTNKKPVFSDNGDKAPYNGTCNYSVNTDLAKSIGYSFSPIKSYIYDLIDAYIKRCDIVLKGI